MDRSAVLEDRYIVVFSDATAASSVGSAQNAVERLGGNVHHEYSAALNGFSATLPAKALERVRQTPGVEYVEADRRVSIAASQSPATWGLDRVDQRNRPLDNEYTYNATGSGVTAYIVDTGILGSHTEFQGRMGGGYTAINDGRGTSDCNGHGTHVAGTVGGSVYGVAKGVRLVPVRVLDCAGSGSYAGIIAGVDWVTGNASGPSVANMSLGGPASAALDNAVTNSIASGVSYAVAAGNSNDNACNYSPARVSSALTVGATTSSDSRSSFSSFGQCLDLFAPGSSITSAWHTSSGATNTISGTSMASPHVAGVAALYLQTNPSASPSAVTNAVVGNATTGVVTNPGAGSPNRLVYSLLGGAPAPDPEPEPEPDPEPDPGDPPPADCDGLAGWSAGSSYEPGDQVAHNGSTWEATWWSTGAEPGAPGSWSSWERTGSC